MTSKMNSTTPRPGSVTFAHHVRRPLGHRTMIPWPSKPPLPVGLRSTRFGPISIPGIPRSIWGFALGCFPTMDIWNLRSCMALTGFGCMLNVISHPGNCCVQAVCWIAQLIKFDPLVSDAKRELAQKNRAKKMSKDLSCRIRFFNRLLSLWIRNRLPLPFVA